MNKTLPTVAAYLSPQIKKLKNYYSIFSKLIIMVVFDHLIKQDSTRQDSVNLLYLR
ncbi:hypothetical protein CLU83_3339 [Flavobacterium sp. 1]|nr:hypothetical protein CLU83_3339 [Flavobacterium sp. 1]